MVASAILEMLVEYLVTEALIVDWRCRSSWAMIALSIGWVVWTVTRKKLLQLTVRRTILFLNSNLVVGYSTIGNLTANSLVSILPKTAEP